MMRLDHCVMDTECFERNKFLNDQHHLRSTFDKNQFDIWSLIKRPMTANSYQLTARYRVKSAPVRRAKSGVVTRRRRRLESRAESEGCESIHSITTATDCTFFDLDKDLPDDFFDQDDDEADSPRRPQSIAGTHSQKMYLRTCKAMRITPTNYVFRHLAEEKMDLKHHLLGPEGAKACAISLVENSTVQSLDLEDNAVGVKGAGYIAEMLTENSFITELQGNNLQEYDGALFSNLIEDSQNLKELKLSHNCFCEIGGITIGDALGWNDTIEFLDLSWNHLRRSGATSIAKGIGINSGLKVLDLSWNGFYLDGCKELANALEKNSTLEDINLSSNRINKQCLQELWKGLKKNETLQKLRLSDNPITSSGAYFLLNSLRETKSSGLNYVDLGTQCVEGPFVTMLQDMQEQRSLQMKYGAVWDQSMEAEDDEMDLVDENPVLILMEFGKLLGLRLTDLFCMMDKDNSKTLTRKEIKCGLLECNIPLSEKAVDHLVEKLDQDGDGEIDYGELTAGHQQHRRKLTKTIMMSRERNVDMEDTDVGRVRKKLQKLMAKQLGGAILNTGFSTITDLARKNGKVVDTKDKQKKARPSQKHK
ncbi:leucine-rich repeat-containing protein 74A-like [Haliotis rubra]|uniref:leucine-rich repeat-containing protein 74A-like n=1 Tax=Haliotis rubra TaxID=36100 RepID=UPI001EE552C3|nr:leucine-rich repeat-containing protein 74A-like [Haliotis rubra]